MLSMILSWIRNGVKTAFLGGIQDALADLGANDGSAQDVPEDVLAALKQRFALAAEPVAVTSGRKQKQAAA